MMQPVNQLPRNHSCRFISELLDQNHLARTVPSTIQKGPNTTISNTEVQAHNLMQIMASLGLPASVIPVLYKDPQNVGIAIGVGIIGGCVFRLFTTSSPQRLQQTAERTATMVNLVKISTVSLQTLFIAANTVANFVIPMFVQNAQLYSYAQGVLGGAHLGYEVAGMSLSSILEMIATPNELSTVNNSSPAIIDNSALLNHNPDLNSPVNTDTTIEMGRMNVIPMNSGEEV